VPIQIRFTLTFKDYLNVLWLHRDRHWRPGFTQFMTTRFLPGVGLLLVIGGFTISERKFSSDTLVTVGFGLGLMSYPLLSRLYLARCYRATRPENTVWDLEFSPEIVRAQEPNSRGEYQWSAFISYSESKLIFLLYLAPARFIAIPKRACSESQINDLRALFLAHFRTAN
jgi:hypothetical protein